MTRSYTITISDENFAKLRRASELLKPLPKPEYLPSLEEIRAWEASQRAQIEAASTVEELDAIPTVTT